MRVVVCVKHVPGPDAPTGFDADGRILRGTEPVLDEADPTSVEVALRLAATGDTVTLLTMGPVGDSPALRGALAMGADDAVIVSDDALRGADALATATVIAQAVRRLAPDLVVAATESSDGYTGAVPVQVAELLGWPSVSFVHEVGLVDGALRAVRQMEDGDEVVSCPLPAVITVGASFEVRYPSLRDVMAARAKPVDVLSLVDLGIDAAAVAPRQRVDDVAPAEARGAGEVITDDGTGVDRLLDALSAWTGR